MKKITCFVAIIFITSIVCCAQTTKTSVDVKKSETVTKMETSNLKWYMIDEVLGLAAKNPKKIFIDVYTDWCGWCKVMDKQTFTDPKVIAYMNANFYPVKFNAEQKAPVTFGDRTFNFIATNDGRGAHELAYALMQGKMSYPTAIYMDENGELIFIVPGYQKPQDILPILVFFAEEHYKKISWEDFLTKLWVSRQKELNL